jgi:uncharacterized protein (TIGR02246 family)
MSTQAKQLLQRAFDALATGDGRPFVALMADDFSWTIPGNATWSGTWRGKKAVREELLAPLFARFADTYTNRAIRFIAEGDWVVVECRGKVMTKSGKAYNNTYCYVCRFAEGEMRELTEYMDTELAALALGAP